MWVGVAIFLGLRELRAGNSPEPKVRLQDSEILKVENRLKYASYFHSVNIQKRNT